MPSSVTAASRGVLTTLVVTLVMLGIGACNRQITKESLVGSYQLSAKAGTIFLELFPDGAFVETVNSANGLKSVQSGKWTAPSPGAPQIGIDGLWLPPEFSPDYVNEADKRAGTGPKYTEPGYWVGTPAYEFGKLVIPIFPDSDMKFERVSTASSR